MARARVGRYRLRKETRMADPHPDPDSEDDPGGRFDRRSTTSTPRWMLVLGVVVAIGLIALFVVLHLTGTLGPGVHQ